MALKACGECGKEISDTAPSCPQCGALQVAAKKSASVGGGGIGCLALVAFVVVIAIVNSGEKSTSTPAASGNSVVVALREKKEVCQRNVSQLVGLGTVKLSDSEGMTVAEYYRPLWSALDHDDKVRQGLLIFCAKMPDSGNYSVLIKDRQSGETMGSVVDGNYWD